MEHEKRLRRDEKTNKMKKYLKLVLVVIAVVSLISFIFYKHKYDRLYNVMEVLEIFGTPEDPNFKCPNAGSQTSPRLGQVSSWQRITDNLYVYSAYCDSLPHNSRGCALITALAVSTLTPANLHCKLWYEGSFHAIEGVFSQQAAPSDIITDFVTYNLNCENQFPNKIPYGVTFYSDKGSPETQVPISVPGGVSSPPTISPSSLRLCLLPQDSPIDSTRAARENILFHSFLGVRHFFIYSHGLSASFFDTLDKLVRQFDISVTLVPWNVPFPLLTSSTIDLVQRDCFYQSRNLFQSFLTLSLNQVIVPKNSPNMTAMFKLLKRHRLLTNGLNRLRLKRFCSEYPNDAKAQNLVQSITLLESTTYNKDYSKDKTVDLHHKDENVKNYSVGIPAISEYVSVHEYSACDNYDFSANDQSAAYDPTILRFSDDFQAFFEKFTNQ